MQKSPPQLPKTKILDIFILLDWTASTNRSVSQKKILCIGVLSGYLFAMQLPDATLKQQEAP